MSSDSEDEIMSDLSKEVEVAEDPESETGLVALRSWSTVVRVSLPSTH